MTSMCVLLGIHRASFVFGLDARGSKADRRTTHEPSSANPHLCEIPGVDIDGCAEGAKNTASFPANFPGPCQASSCCAGNAKKRVAHCFEQLVVVQLTCNMIAHILTMRG